MNNNLLRPFIGKWNTYGVIEKTPFGPAGVLRGQDKYEWFERKQFVIHKVNVKMGRKKLITYEIICFDERKGSFAMYGFDNAKTSGIQHGHFRGHKWFVDGAGIRFRGEFNRERSKLVGEWQYRVKSSWKRWMSLELTRIKK